MLSCFYGGASIIPVCTSFSTSHAQPLCSSADPHSAHALGLYSHVLPARLRLESACPSSVSACAPCPRPLPSFVSTQCFLESGSTGDPSCSAFSNFPDLQEFLVTCHHVTPVLSPLKRRPSPHCLKRLPYTGYHNATFLGTERCDFEVERIFVRLTDASTSPPSLGGHAFLYSFMPGFL